MFSLFECIDDFPAEKWSDTSTYLNSFVLPMCTVGGRHPIEQYIVTLTQRTTITFSINGIIDESNIW